MKTSKLIAERLKNAHMVLNIDGASGLLSEETGEPLYWTWQGAEKTYIDFQLEVTNPGGHSSAPRPDNAIAQLSQRARADQPPTASRPRSTTSPGPISRRSRRSSPIR